MSVSFSFGLLLQGQVLFNYMQKNALLLSFINTFFSYNQMRQTLFKYLAWSFNFQCAVTRFLHYIYLKFKNYFAIKKLTSHSYIVHQQMKRLCRKRPWAFRNINIIITSECTQHILFGYLLRKGSGFSFF